MSLTEFEEAVIVQNEQMKELLAEIIKKLDDMLGDTCRITGSI